MHIAERFEQFDDEYLKFDRVQSKLNRRCDLHAFILLEQLFPAKNNEDMIAHAEHDMIWLDVAGDELIDSLCDVQIRELVRCGVLYDIATESLYMNV